MNSLFSKKALVHSNSSVLPTILVAEYDDGHAELIRKNLQRLGIVNKIERAVDGQDAIDRIFGDGVYQEVGTLTSFILLLDINMPKLNGHEVLHKIKAREATSTVPVIILTTTEDPREIQRCYDLGCNIYIVKPVAYEAFIEAISRLGLFLQVLTYPPN